MDYYQVLGALPRSCTDTDIKQQYRKCCLQWHPSRHEEDNKQTAAAHFRNISEAYFVLRDPKLRAIFDQWGEKGLKTGVTTVRGGFTGAWSFTANPEDLFSDFFGTTSPFAEFFGDDAGLSLDARDTGKQNEGQLPEITHNLYCSLEEIFQGCTKKFKVTRQRLGLDGKSVHAEEKLFTIQVHPGWRVGTRIAFKGAGDEGVNNVPGDVAFILKERPHPRFRREKNDLVYPVSLSLAKALVGSTVDVQTLDNRSIPVPVSQIVTPGSRQVVPNEGMPNPRNPNTRGNLVLEFSVQFPDQLTIAQKQQLASILA